MSKRHGDVQVADYSVIRAFALVEDMLTFVQNKGWEPVAVLNWLALTGWGTSSSPSGGPVEKAPSTTEVLAMEDLILKASISLWKRRLTLNSLVTFSQFDLSALTHRRTILEPSKLEVLNKRHLARKAESAAGLASLAARAHTLILVRFPEACASSTLNFLSSLIRYFQRN